MFSGARSTPEKINHTRGLRRARMRFLRGRARGHHQDFRPRSNPTFGVPAYPRRHRPRGRDKRLLLRPVLTYNSPSAHQPSRPLRGPWMESREPPRMREGSRPGAPGTRHHQHFPPRAEKASPVHPAPGTTKNILPAHPGAPEIPMSCLPSAALPELQPY